jgi:hypothetical protein
VKVGGGGDATVIHRKYRAKVVKYKK